MSSLLKIAVLLVAVAGTSNYVSLCFIPFDYYQDCSDWGLSMPPPGFWPNVTILILRYNAITELSTNSLSGFPALQFLILTDNNITRFNFGALAKNTDLISLTITHNQIGTFMPPPRGTNLQNLRRIYAGSNRISNLDPDLFLFANNLTLLDISNNPLIVESGHPLLNHPELTELRMSFGGTGPNVFDSSLLAGLPKLRWLELPSSDISSVEGDFVNNKDLWYVDLQGNDITQVSPGSFATGGRIGILLLNGNPLNILDPTALDNVFASSKYYREIDIRETPLACQCRYEGLLSWAETKNITIRASCSGQNNCSFASPP